jgi:formiminotetrahydrofolate cyclodeaminase
MTVSLWQQPLSEVQSLIAGTQPAPAGVATATTTAALGLSLLIKVLRITGKRADLLEPAERLVEELRAIADADVAAVHAYIQRRETKGLHEVPKNAANTVAAALHLATEAKGAVTGLIAADVLASIALLQGASNAISACVAANER